MAADSDDEDFLSELLAHGRLQVQQRLFHVADSGNFFMSELLRRAPAPASSHQIVQVGQLGGQDPRDAAAKTFSSPTDTLAGRKSIPSASATPADVPPAATPQKLPVQLRLSPSSLASAVLEHCSAIVHGVLARGPTIFKIGVTRDPEHRWSNPRYGYRLDTDRYEQIICMCAVQSAEAAGFVEAALLREFIDLSGCRNIAKGGDGLPYRQGSSVTYFVYVVHRKL